MYTSNHSHTMYMRVQLRLSLIWMGLYTFTNTCVDSSRTELEHYRPFHSHLRKETSNNHMHAHKHTNNMYRDILNIKLMYNVMNTNILVYMYTEKVSFNM